MVAGVFFWIAAPFYLRAGKSFLNEFHNAEVRKTE